MRLQALGAEVRVCAPPDEEFEERLAGARPVAEKLRIRYVYASFRPVTLPSPYHPPQARPGRPFPPGKSSATNDSEGSGE